MLTKAHSCPRCDGTVHVDKPWLDGVCLACGASVDAAHLRRAR